MALVIFRVLLLGFSASYYKILERTHAVGVHKQPDRYLWKVGYNGREHGLV